MLKAADIYYRSPREVKKFTFQYAKALKRNMPKSWHDNEVADADWFTLFKRHKNLSIKNQRPSGSPITEQ